MGIVNFEKIDKNKQGVGREGARRGRKRKAKRKLAGEEGEGRTGDGQAQTFYKTATQVHLSHSYL